MQTATTFSLSSLDRAALQDLWDDSLAGNHAEGFDPNALPSVREDLREPILSGLAQRGIVRIFDGGAKGEFTDLGKTVFVDFETGPDIDPAHFAAQPARKTGGQVAPTAKKGEGLSAPKKSKAPLPPSGLPRPHRDSAKRIPGRCEKCEGTGFLPRGGNECPACNMTGKKSAAHRAADKGQAAVQAAGRAQKEQEQREILARAERVCPVCQGTGRHGVGNCFACKGTGERQGKAPSAVRTTKGKAPAPKMEGTAAPRSRELSAEAAAVAARIASAPTQGGRRLKLKSEAALGEKRVAVLRAMHALQAVDHLSARTAEEIATKAGLQRKDVVHYNYKDQALQQFGYVEGTQQDGSRVLSYFLTDKGVQFVADLG